MSEPVENQKSSQTTSQNRLWSKLKTLDKNYYIAAGIAVVIVIAGISYLALNKKTETKSTPQNQVVTNSNQSTDIKKLASQKLQSISGVSYQDLQSVMQPMDQSAKLASAINPSNPIISDKIENTTDIDTQKALELVSSKNIQDDKVFYSETEYTNHLDPDNESLQYYNLQLDNKKPYTTKIWYSANYSKSIMMQNDKIISFALYTPEYSVDYYGGKYAIKETYAQKRYLSGFATGDNGNSENPEIYFLKSILQDTGVTRLGQKQVDGKNLEVVQVNSLLYASSIDSVQSEFKTRYYIDLNNFSLYLTENYQGDKLQNSQKTINSQTYTGAKSDDYFNTVELGKIEIKSVTIDYENDYQKSTSLENFVKKYGIYYLSSLNNSFYVSDSSYYLNQENYKLRNSTDFYPSMTTIQSTVPSDAPLAVGYYSNASVNSEVYDKEPVFDTPKDQTTVTDVNVTIGKQKIKAKFYLVKNSSNIGCDSKLIQETNGATSAPACPVVGNYNTRYLLFKYNNYWFKINDNTLTDSSPLAKSDITLTAMSIVEAQKIDTFVKQKQESYPQITSAKLEDIDSKIRLLPGDLTSKYKLSLSSVIKSSKPAEKSRCLDFLESIYDVNSCLIEKYNGFGMYFYENSDRSATTSSISSKPEILPSDSISYVLNNLQVAVIDASINDLNNTQIQNLKNSSQSNITLEIKPDRMVVSDVVSNIKLIFIKVKDKTVMLQLSSYNQGTITDEQYIQIVQNMEYDKDIDVLKSQVQSYGTLYPVSGELR